MSDVCLWPLSLLWLVALSMKIYTWHDTRHWKLWKWLWQKEVVKTHFKRLQHISLSTVCCVRGVWHYTHTHRPSEWSKVFKSVPQQLKNHVSAPGVDELNCSMRCKNWKNAQKYLWSMASCDLQLHLSHLINSLYLKEILQKRVFETLSSNKGPFFGICTYL